METLDPHLHTWIAENILLGSDVGQLKAALVSLGASEDLADREITAAQNHPYIAAARQQMVTLRKREGLLKTLDYYQRYDPRYLKPERVPLPPYADFLRDYVAHSHAGVFTGAFDHWPARHWTPQSILAQVGADTMVEVQYGRNSRDDFEINGHTLRRPMPFWEFITHMESSVGNDIYLTANNLAADKSHFAFVNEDTGTLGDGYLDPTQSGQLFLWMGPAGTVTPMHHDLTHNIFFQIYGSKRFRLYPALQVPYMHNTNGVFSPIDPLLPVPDQHALFNHAQVIDITIGPGDMLYIPMACWHHVVGVTPSISLTTTRLNHIPNQFLGYPGVNAPGA